MSTSAETDPLLNTTVTSEPLEHSTMGGRNFNNVIKIFVTSTHLLGHSLIGATVFVVMWFAFHLTPMSAFQLHIILSVIGYQLLMSHGILCINNYAGWSSSLTILHRHRIHWVLQLTGSVLAIAGAVIMMREKAVNFNTLHGRLALAALVIVCISLMNGVMTLYRLSLSRIVPAASFKTSHLFLGIAAFTISSVCLAFGYRKKSFMEWASSELSWVMIGMTSVLTSIVIAKPFYTLSKKFTEVMKIKIF